MAFQGRTGTWPSNGVLPQHAEGPESPLTAPPENYKFSKLDTVIYDHNPSTSESEAQEDGIFHAGPWGGGGGGN